MVEGGATGVNIKPQHLRGLAAALLEVFNAIPAA